jgi:hypothetical protein
MSDATIHVRSSRSPLPRPIRQVLDRLARRLRAASVLRGLGTTALVLAFAAALGMEADFAWVLPRSARWMIWGASVAIGALTFMLTVLRPVVRRLAAFDLAAVAEQSHPELLERLTGAVALLGRETAAHGSPALISSDRRDPRDGGPEGGGPGECTVGNRWSSFTAIEGGASCRRCASI